jgi:23S rRNA maturation mini-RNase III
MTYREKRIAEFREKFANAGGDYDGSLEPLEAFLSATIEECRGGKVQMIVDMFEMRNSTILPVRDKEHSLQDTAKYNFFNAAIARLCDKYKIDDRDLEEEVYRRNRLAVEAKFEGKVIDPYYKDNTGLEEQQKRNLSLNKFVDKLGKEDNGNS